MKVISILVTLSVISNLVSIQATHTPILIAIYYSLLKQLSENFFFFFFFFFKKMKVISILVTLYVISNLVSIQATHTPILIAINHLSLNLPSRIFLFSIFSNHHFDGSIHYPKLDLYGS